MHFESRSAGMGHFLERLRPRSHEEWRRGWGAIATNTHFAHDGRIDFSAKHE